MKANQYKNVNDLVFAITTRVKELSNEPINTLRLHIGTADTFTGAVAESKHKNRGELIEEIIDEEFAEEYPHYIRAEE